MARKTAEESALTRRQIADSANELFIRKGYNGTSMEDIHSLSGASKGSIYHHFKSKQQLFLYILEMNITGWIDKWRQLAGPHMSAAEKLYALAAHWADDFDNPLVKAIDEFTANHASDPEMTGKLIAISRLHYPVATEILRDGMASGAFRQDDVETLTSILIGTLSGLGVAYYENMEREKIHAMYRKAIDLFIRGIAVHDAGK